jgi:hypothetical protein
MASTGYNHLVGETLHSQKAKGKLGGHRIVLYQQDEAVFHGAMLTAR